MKAARHTARAGLLAILLIAAFGVCAAEPDDPQHQAPAKKKAAENERVCRMMKMTGSYVRKKVCLSQRDWERMQKDVERGMRNGAPLFEGRPGPG